MHDVGFASFPRVVVGAPHNTEVGKTEVVSALIFDVN